MKVSYTLTKLHEDLERILRVMVFNLMAHNRDDHSNTIFGEGKDPGLEHVQKIADEFSIKRSLVLDIVGQTSYALSQWKFLCGDLGISKKATKEIGKRFKDLL